MTVLQIHAAKQCSCFHHLICRNHELEFQPDGTVMAAYNARFPVPQTLKPQLTPLTLMPGSPESTASQSTHSTASNMYYSFDIPGVAHMIFISPYIPNDTWTSDTPQVGAYVARSSAGLGFYRLETPQQALRQQLSTPCLGSRQQPHQQQQHSAAALSSSNHAARICCCHCCCC